MPRLNRITFYLLLFWWVILSAGCRAPHVSRQDGYGNTVAWNRNIAHGRDDWLAEARKRFANPFIVVVHGDTSDGKHWWIAPDNKGAKANIEAVGLILHSLMPDRDVVFVSCNAAGLTPHLPKRVWFARKAVWSEPEGASIIPPDDDCVADIWAFVEGKE